MRLWCFNLRTADSASDGVRLRLLGPVGPRRDVSRQIKALRFGFPNAKGPRPNTFHSYTAFV